MGVVVPNKHLKGCCFTKFQQHLKITIDNNHNNRTPKVGDTIVMSPKCAQLFGIVSAAFLQQLRYWMFCSNDKIGQFHDERRWIYNTYEEWLKQINITSERTLRRHINKLESLGIVLSTNLNSNKSNQTKWYTIDYEKLASYLSHEIIPSKESCKTKKIPKKAARSSGQNDQPLLASSKKAETPLITQFSNPSNSNNKTRFISNQHKKVARPSGQNDQIIHRTNTTSITSSSTTEARVFSKEEDKKENSDREQQAVLMLDVWNKGLIEKGRQPVSMTKTRAAFLNRAFCDKFNSSLDSWKAYCQAIFSNSFLMGENKSGWRADLDWILDFEHMQHIFEGRYGEGTPLITPRYENNNNTIQEIQHSGESEVTKTIRFKLIDGFGEATYRSWFREVDIFQQGSRIKFVCPNLFVRDWLGSRLELEIKKIISALPEFKKSFELDFVLAENVEE